MAATFRKPIKPPTKEESDSVWVSTAKTVLSYSQTTIKFALNWGWLPMCFVLGASSIYCEPTLDLNHILPPPVDMPPEGAPSQ